MCHRNEQEYLSSALMEKNALVYWPDHWCRSFKRHCLKPLSFFIARNAEIPEDARVIVFHGKPDPPRGPLLASAENGTGDSNRQHGSLIIGIKIKSLI